MLAEPTPRRDGGTRSETEEVAVGGGPGGGVRFGVFRVLGLVDDRAGDWLHFPHVLEFLAMSGMDVGARLPVADLDALRRAFPFRGELARVGVTLDD